ncbi:YkgJ family cysteine cluster protein [Candidatus Bathyarchaeota archaeon]|nr:YkgJ family cysteine cluster protein [Candidatus Bathyarchaeota archaeon]
MNIIPWGRVHNWSCIRCSECCQLKVQITTAEWLGLTRTFGYNIISQETDGFFLNKALDGWCPFLFKSNPPSCGLQKTKPLACELWPFRISEYPRYGMEEEANFHHRGRVFYIYAIPYCRGFRYGTPTEHFTKNVLPEFVDVRLGLKRSQVFSTGNYHSQRY